VVASLPVLFALNTILDVLDEVRADLSMLDYLIRADNNPNTGKLFAQLTFNLTDHFWDFGSNKIQLLTRFRSDSSRSSNELPGSLTFFYVMSSITNLTSTLFYRQEDRIYRLWTRDSELTRIFGVPLEERAYNSRDNNKSDADRVYRNQEANWKMQNATCLVPASRTLPRWTRDLVPDLRWGGVVFVERRVIAAMGKEGEAEGHGREDLLDRLWEVTATVNWTSGTRRGVDCEDKSRDVEHLLLCDMLPDGIGESLQTTTLLAQLCPGADLGNIEEVSRELARDQAKDDEPAEACPGPDQGQLKETPPTYTSPPSELRKERAWSQVQDGDLLTKDKAEGFWPKIKSWALQYWSILLPHGRRNSSSSRNQASATLHVNSTNINLGNLPWLLSHAQEDSMTPYAIFQHVLPTFINNTNKSHTHKLFHENLEASFCAELTSADLDGGEDNRITQLAPHLEILVYMYGTSAHRRQLDQHTMDDSYSTITRARAAGCCVSAWFVIGEPWRNAYIRAVLMNIDKQFKQAGWSAETELKGGKLFEGYKSCKGLKINITLPFEWEQTANPLEWEMKDGEWHAEWARPNVRYRRKNADDGVMELVEMEYEESWQVKRVGKAACEWIGFGG
jgi:hypothetical protein